MILYLVTGMMFYAMALIRKIHDELMHKKLTKKDKQTNRYLKQIDI